MSYYYINYSEPLKAGFQVNAGGSDGPGAATVTTSLRIYGQGALSWGEAVDEDLIRLAENFSGASAPPSPIHGQFWIENSLYYRDITAGTPYQGWWLFDPNSKQWGQIGTNGTVGSTPVPSAVYYYDTNTATLYGFFSLVAGMTQDFVPRSYMTGSGIPPNTLQPQLTLHMWDANVNSGAGAWITPSTVSSQDTAPMYAQPSSLWFQPSTSILSVYDGTSWHQILSGSSSGVVIPGDINMQNTYHIINLPAPVNASDAATKAYVDGTVSSSVQGYLPLSGGTLSGPLVVNGLLTLNGGISAGNRTITNVGPGVYGSDAVNLNQMNSAISTSISSAISSNVPSINNGGSYKAGDIAVVNGAIYIAIAGGAGSPPGGNWKQVYPAIYAS